MTTEEFLDFLERSGLMPPEKMEALRADAHAKQLAQSDAAPYAESLIKAKIITPFHAERLLRGKWRNFIINDKFRVLDRWDAGDLGIFFRCEHLTLRKNMTLRSHASLNDTEENDLKGLLERIRELSQVNDPHLGRLIDLERVNGQPLLVMEDLRGPSVEDLVSQQGPLPADQAAAYILQAALALQTLHENGWMHGEARPARMIFDPMNALKLVDAGMSEWFGNPRQGSRSKSRRGDKGFPLWDYQAPEMLTKQGQADGRSDLYSLGCTFYQLLTGQPPFASFAPADKVKAHQFAEPPNLAQIRPDVPAPLLQLIRRLLAKKQDQRPASAIEVAQELMPYAQSLLPPVTQAMLGIASISSDMGPEVEHRRSLSPAKQKGGKSSAGAKAGAAASVRPAQGGRRKKIATIVAAAIALVALTAFLFVWLSSGALGGMKFTDRLAAIRNAIVKEDNVKAADLLAEGLKQADAAKNENERRQLLALLSQVSQEDLTMAVAARAPNDAGLLKVTGDLAYNRRSWQSAMGSYVAAHRIDPNDAAILDRCVETTLRVARWKEAADLQAELAALKPQDAGEAMKLAVILAKAEDWPAYRKQISDMWRRFKDSRNPADIAQIGYALAVAKDQPPEAAEALEALKKNAEKAKGLGWPRYALGAVMYRQGQLDEAAAELKAAYAETPNWEGRRLCQPLLSLAQFKTGQVAEGRKTLRDADDWQRQQRADTAGDSLKPITKAWWDWLCFDLALREARGAFSQR